jgi:hypothetical protein
MASLDCPFDDKLLGRSRKVVSLLDNFENTTVFPTCSCDDPHWNEQGAAIAAEAIYRFCAERGILSGTGHGFQR